MLMVRFALAAAVGYWSTRLIARCLGDRWVWAWLAFWGAGLLCVLAGKLLLAPAECGE